jgi:hypothetical protein
VAALAYLITPVFAQVVPFQLAIGNEVPPGPRAVRAVIFSPNLDAIRSNAAQMSVVLPGGESVIIQRTRFEDRGNGDAQWAGRVLLEEGSSVLLTLRDGIVFGLIQRRLNEFSIGTWVSGAQVLEEINRNAPRGEAFAPTPAGAEAARATSAVPLAAAASEPVESEIDLLVLYTSQARTALGGTAQIEAAIQNSVDYANTAFVNSLIPAHYRVVLTRLTSDVPIAVNDPDDGANLQTLSFNSNVAVLRNEVGADLVMLVTGSLKPRDGFQICGIAAPGNVIGPVGPGNFVQETSVACSTLGHTVAHENGHLLGMDHNPEDPAADPQYPWSHGHQVAGMFSTIMSNCGCPLIPNFSNPDVLYLGVPTGIPDQRDNARTGRINAPLVAAFKPAGPSAIPDVPTGLNGSFANGAGMLLGWFPATNATAYDVQRSTDGENFALIGSVTGDNHFTDPNVSSPNTYHYRVRGRNFRGVSDYSAVRTIVMPVPPAAPSGLTATPLGTSEIRLNWTDNASDELGFAVEMLVNGNWEIVDGADGANVTTRTVVGLQPSTAYSFRVFVYSNDFESLRSNSASATTLGTNAGGVSGYAWNDANRNGAVDKGETPAGGLVIFYDPNGNGVNDESPATAITVSGTVRNLPGTNIPFIAAPNYTLSGLPVGSKRICASFDPSLAGRASCRTVTVGTGTTQNVNFTVVDGRVGVSTMTPRISTIREGDKVAFDIRWTHTDGKWVLLKDATIRFAKSDGKDAIQILFDELTRTFSHVDKGTVGPGAAGGSPLVFETHDAILYLQESSAVGTGPTGPSLTLHLVLSFKPSARGPLDVQLKLTDDQGYVQGFDSLGQVTVVK